MTLVSNGVVRARTARGAAQTLLKTPLPLLLTPIRYFPWRYPTSAEYHNVYKDTTTEEGLRMRA